LLEIYAPFVVGTAVTFEYEVPSKEEFSGRIIKYIQEYPWLVVTYNEHPVAYAYASKHRDRAAYQWSVESSVYVHPSFRKKGIAGKLYDALFGMLRITGDRECLCRHCITQCSQ
jgi:phosphinothricin acetyltransferase